MSMSTRKRTNTFFKGSSSEVVRNSGQYVSTNTQNWLITGNQVTMSTNNKLWRQIRRILNDPKTDFDTRYRLTHGDLGSTFYSSNQSFEMSHPKYRSDNLVADPAYNVTYNGPLGTLSRTIGPSSFPSTSVADSIALNQMGTFAISQTIPTNPHVDLATSLMEIKHEGLPSVPLLKAVKAHGRGNTAHHVGDEYLNMSFGISPIISDISKSLESVRDTHKVLEQYHRDSGKLVHRHLNLPGTNTTTVTTVPNTQVVGPSNSNAFSNGGNGYGLLTRTETRTRKAWFSGCYTYHLDPRTTMLGKMKGAADEANKLYGVEPNLATLWNLEPWSWLVDYELNLGDVIHNLSYIGKDGLVLVYGYLMCTDEIKVERTLTGIRFASGSPGPITDTFTTTVKQRIKATPYGFGLNPNGFSAGQWANLAALGLGQSGKLL